MNCREALVTAESPQRKGLLFGALRPRARMPALRDGEHLYHAARDVEGLRTLRRIVDSSDHLPIAAEDRFYRALSASVQNFGFFRGRGWPGAVRVRWGWPPGGRSVILAVGCSLVSSVRKPCLRVSCG